MKIIHKDSFKVVGIKVIAGWDELWEEMPRAWLNFFKRSGDIKNKVNNTFIDISLDKRDDKYTQLICAEVSEFGDIPSDMEVVTVPKQQYIYHRHTGTLQEIASSFGKMYDWAAEHEHDAGDFKIDVGYTKDRSESGHDLFVRIAGGGQNNAISKSL